MPGPAWFLAWHQTRLHGFQEATEMFAALSLCRKTSMESETFGPGPCRAGAGRRNSSGPPAGLPPRLCPCRGPEDFCWPAPASLGTGADGEGDASRPPPRAAAMVRQYPAQGRPEERWKGARISRYERDRPVSACAGARGRAERCSAARRGHGPALLCEGRRRLLSGGGPRPVPRHAPAVRFQDRGHGLAALRAMVWRL